MESAEIRYSRPLICLGGSLAELKRDRFRVKIPRERIQVVHAVKADRSAEETHDMQTGSPNNDGKGDWGEEWSYVYPNGTYTRHMEIHTALRHRVFRMDCFVTPAGDSRVHGVHRHRPGGS